MSVSINLLPRRFAGALSVLAAALCFTALPGCGPTYAGPPACIVGSGLFGFVPLTGQDQKIPIIHGMQGGFHIWGSVLIRFMDPERVKLSFTLSMADMAVTRVPATTAFTTPDPSTLPEEGPGSEAAKEAGWEESLGQRVFVLDPMAIDGKVVRLHVDATDAWGRTSSDERSFTVHL